MNTSINDAIEEIIKLKFIFLLFIMVKNQTRWENTEIRLEKNNEVHNRETFDGTVNCFMYNIAIMTSPL